MTRPLAGVRVLDLTNVLAGPFCAYQLALLGAEVTKIEVPEGGDLARQLGADVALNEMHMGTSFLAQNAGKRSVTLNLKSEAGKEVFMRLIGDADVLVENFRPGVMTRLGIDYETLRARNPRLVYCAISGFGQEGPMRSTPAYDQIIQGLSGVMSITGTRESAPLRVGYPIADTLSGMTAAFAIASSLVRRHATGEGAFIDVSMLDSTLVTMGWVVSNYLIAGVDPQPHGNDNFTAAPSGTFRAQDGLINISANKQEQFEALMRVVDRAHLIDDERFAHRDARKANRAALSAEIDSALATRTSREWEKVLNELGIPAGRVLTVPQALALPQTAERSLLKSFASPSGVGRPITVVRAGFRLSDGDPDVDEPPPLLGQHTDETLRQAGYSDDEIGALRAERAI